MAMNITEAKVRITAQTVGEQNIDALKRQIEGLHKSVGGISKGFERFGALAKGFIGAELVKGFGNFIYKSIELGDHLNDLSQKFGVSVEAISTFSDAGATAGADLETVAKSFAKLSKAEVEAATGNKSAAAAFKVLGLSVKDANGNLKDAGVMALDIADKFKTMKDGPEKAALSMKLFGKAGADMIPTLNMGSAAIEQFGSKMSGDFARMADAFNDKIEGVKIKFRNLSIVGATELLPTLNDIIDAFSGLESQGPDAVTFFDGVGELARLAAFALGEVYFAVMDVGGALATAAQQAWAIAHGNWEKVKQLQKERDADQTARNASEKAFMDKMLGNSLIFGSGSVAQIKARQQASVKPAAPRLGQGGSPDLSALDTTAADEGKKKLEEYEAALGGLKGKAAQLNFEIANFAKYGDKVTSAQGALMRFETTQGKFKDDTTTQKTALIEAADAVDKLTEARVLQNKVDAEGKDIAKSKIGWEADTQAILDQGKALTMTAFDYDQMIARKKKIAEIDQHVVDWETTTAKAYRDGALAAFDHGQELERLAKIKENTFGGGASAAITTYGKDIADVGQHAFDAWTNALKGTEDALVNFAMTGKLSFKDLANSIISDLMRIAIQQSIMIPLTQALKGMGWLPAATGAAFDTGGVQKFATGGVVSKPTMFAHGGGLGVMGEAGPEAIMPLRRLSNGRLGVESANGGGGIQNVVVNVSVEGGGSQASGDPGKANELGKLVANAVRVELVQQKRPGGLLAA